MIEAPATEVAKRFSRYRLAAQREPVAVTHHGRVTEFLISNQDYDEYARLKSLMTRAMKIEEISDEALEALVNVQMHERHASLDALMDD